MDPAQPSVQPVAKGEDQTSSIPLICLLCPKHPKFSDISHLLTHISSKSHLAAQFRLQHSGKAEDKHALDQYKLWSDNNGVDRLVANRIAAKELKKPTKRQRFVGVKVCVEWCLLCVQISYLHRPQKETGTDIKLEADDSIGAHLEQTPLHPNPNIWHLHAPRDNSFATFYGTPPSYGDHSAYPLPDSPQSSAFIKQETSQSGTETGNTSFLSSAGGIDDGNDASKLKGTVYPGMGLFDAATPLQKRKRNQKKDASVIRNMEMTSASISMDEEVWDITMSEITRTRNVYDSPSIDGSPVSLLLLHPTDLFRQTLTRWLRIPRTRFLLPPRSVAAVCPPWQALALVDRPEQSHVQPTTSRLASADQLVKPRITSSLKGDWNLRMSLVIVLMMRRRQSMEPKQAMFSRTIIRSGRVCAPPRSFQVGRSGRN